MGVNESTPYMPSADTVKCRPPCRRDRACRRAQRRESRAFDREFAHLQCIGVADDRHHEPGVDRDCDADVDLGEQRNLGVGRTRCSSADAAQRFCRRLDDEIGIRRPDVLRLPLGDQLCRAASPRRPCSRPCPSSAAQNCAGCRACAWRWFCECLSRNALSDAGKTRFSQRWHGFRKRFCGGALDVFFRDASARTGAGHVRKIDAEFGRESFCERRRGSRRAAAGAVAATGLAAAARTSASTMRPPGPVPRTVANLRSFRRRAAARPVTTAGVRPMRWGGRGDDRSRCCRCRDRRRRGRRRRRRGDRFTGRIDVTDDVAGLHRHAHGDAVLRCRWRRHRRRG